MEKETLPNSMISKGTKADVSCWNRSGVLKGQAAAVPLEGVCKGISESKCGPEAAV